MPVLTHRITVNEYYRLESAGILAPGQRVELLEGQVVDMMPIGRFHSGVTRNLHNYFAGRCALEMPRGLAESSSY